MTGSDLRSPGPELYARLKEACGSVITLPAAADLVCQTLSDGALGSTIVGSGDFGGGCVVVFPRAVSQRRKVTIRAVDWQGRPTNSVVYIGLLPFDAEIVLSGASNLLAVGTLRYGDKVLFNLTGNATIVVGDDTSIARASFVGRDSTLRIGRDCMLSIDIRAFTSQIHSLVSLDGASAELIWKPAQAEIGDHVWIGEGCKLVGNCVIGSGSVLGAYSVLGGSLPSNCAAAGNPARVIRENVTWSRREAAFDPGTLAYLGTIGVTPQLAGLDQSWRPASEREA